MKMFSKAPEFSQREKNLRLLEAVWSDDLDDVLAFLKAGANPNTHNGYGRGERLDFSSRHAVIPDQISYIHLMWQPLIDASSLGHSKVAQALMDQGADINYQYNGETALMKACKNGHVEIVKQLLSKGADTQIRNGCTSPLEEAAARGNVAVVKAMLEHGVDVHDRYQTRMTSDDPFIEVSDSPLKRAAANGHKEVVELLLKAGANAAQVKGGYLKDAQKHPDIASLLGQEATVAAGAMSAPVRPGQGQQPLMTYDR